MVGLPWSQNRLLTLSEGQMLAGFRLRHFNFEFSPSQRDTLGDGNCLMRALVNLSRQNGLVFHLKDLIQTIWY